MKKIFTLKVMLIIACSMLTSYVASAQGWVGSANGKRLYAVNDSLTFNSLFVGIGTNAPAAQFHTTGTVRLTGIKQNNTLGRLLVQDTIGNVSWRDVSTIAGGGSGNGWSLYGNAGTNGNSDFVGTTDSARLVFRTNNTQKATILSNGNVGIGTAAPIKLLHVHNSDYANSEDNNIFLSGPAPSLYFSQTITQPYKVYTTPYARIGLSTRATTFLLTSQPGDFIIHSVLKGSSILFGVGMDAPGTNGIERARLTSDGNFGINTYSPSAKLHVNGNVRFQNLPAGTGRVLMVNDSGYVVVSGGVVDTLPTPEPEPDTTGLAVTALQQEVSALKLALANIQAQIASLKSGSLDVVTNTNPDVSLSNAPNPFNGTTTIRYTYPATASKAFIIVSDLSGNLVKRFDLKAIGGTSVTLTLDASAIAGTYIYALEVDGVIVESKKMVYSK
jgi:hypothetical protein